MFNSTQKDTEVHEYNEILDKMIKLEKEKKNATPAKITICIVGGIGSVMFIGMLCYSILKTDFSIESILSTLLAFFSIFISIFFYFKADETSTNFYNSSYEFMKDISVTLGKIEERFGEKLNSLNDKVSHLDNIRTKVNEEIQDKKDDKDNIINTLMDKANLSEEERNQFRKQLEEKDNEIDSLKRQKYKAERDARILRRRISRAETEMERIPIPPRRMLENLLRTRDTDNLSLSAFNNLFKLGLLDSNGEIDESAVMDMLNKNY